MAKNSKLTVIAPDGSIVSRRTHRVYTHAILAFGSGPWSACTWCGRPDLAQKELVKWKQRYPEAVMVPVQA